MSLAVALVAGCGGGARHVDQVQQAEFNAGISLKEVALSTAVLNGTDVQVPIHELVAKVRSGVRDGYLTKTQAVRMLDRDAKGNASICPECTSALYDAADIMQS